MHLVITTSSWLCCVILASAAGAMESRAQVPDTVELAKLERLWNDAHRKGDAGALDRLWADELEVVVPQMRPMSKQEVLGFARAGRMSFERYETSEVRYRTATPLGVQAREV